MEIFAHDSERGRDSKRICLWRGFLGELHQNGVIRFKKGTECMAEELTTGQLYLQLKNTLEQQSIIVSFKKKNGDVRVMLGTRNMTTCEKICNRDLTKMLFGFDKKNTAATLNIPVVDLALGEVRTFNVERMLGYQLIGVLDNDEVINKAFGYYEQVSDFVNKQVEDAKNKKKGGEIGDKNDSLINKI